MHFAPCSCSPRLGPRHGALAVTNLLDLPRRQVWGRGLTLLWVSTPWEWN